MQVFQRFPSLGRGVVHAWAACRPAKHPERHWLFLKLKEQTKSRVRKQYSLAADLKLVADPYEFIGMQLAQSSVYEPDTVATLQAVIKPGMIVADVGANIGYYTVILGRLVGPNGSVHAFEPYPDSLSDLRRNTEINQLRNVSVSSCALSSSHGAATLYLGHGDVTNSLQPTKHSGNEAIAITTETLDRYASTHELRRLDLIKIDVEGAERDVISGASSVLEALKPMLLLEFSIHSKAFGYTDANLRSHLETRGYTLFRAGTPPLRRFEGLRDEEFCNVLAVHQESISAFESVNVLMKCHD
jgi:FkbM family methyltransferase